MKIDFTDKKVAILGLGIEGIASALFLNTKGAEVTILDQRGEQEIDPKLLKRAQDMNAQLHFGKDAFQNLEQYSTVVRSPGIKLLPKEIENLESNRVLVTSQIKLFFDFCTAPIIGVTGTKGKGTTSSLIYQMLKEQGVDAYLGGNIGVPPFEFLEKLNKDSWVVLELSSFQLQDLHISPHIAVMLMITQEHLAPDKGLGPYENYHTDVYEYIEAKRNIVRFQKKEDFTILNRDYPATNESDVYTEGKIFQVSRERGVIDEGCFVRDGSVWIKRGGLEEELIKTEDILLPGAHNLENVCAAVMAAVLANVQKKHIVSVLKTFKGLEHRLELVRELNGVKYYDDSFSTTPETAIAAIQAFKTPEILILGGAHKGSDFKELGCVIRDAKNIKAIIGIGVEWKRIKEKIMNHESGIMLIERAKTMEQIVAAASKIGQPGDVVLLSPACSSFDMFKNYKERGDQFKEEVLKL